MAAPDGIDALVRAVRQRIEREGLKSFATRTGIPLGQLRSVAAGRAVRYTTLQSIAAVMGMRLRRPLTRFAWCAGLLAPVATGGQCAEVVVGQYSTLRR